MRRSSDTPQSTGSKIFENKMHNADYVKSGFRIYSLAS